jgi:hypothetical protein
LAFAGFALAGFGLAVFVFVVFASIGFDAVFGLVCAAAANENKLIKNEIIVIFFIN